MKKYILITITICSMCIKTYAQDCKNFVYMTNGKVVKYSSTNAKGKLITNLIYTVKAIAGNKATVNSAVINDKGKELSTADVIMECNGNNMNIDMRSLMPNSNASPYKNMTVKATSSFLNYPAKMQAGQNLPDGNFTMEMYEKDNKMMDVALQIKDRKVESKESITTNAGTFDCIKITYNTQVKTTTMGMTIPLNMKMTEWYAPILGLYVKSEASTNNGKLTSTTVLDSIN